MAHKPKLDPKERETERPSKIFGEIHNQQTSMDVTYKQYNIRTGRCARCQLGSLREELGDCGAVDSHEVECFLEVPTHD
tara:strand:+ start:1140 stop:1376 length:237 start_codon:yes stop_codon:yes gene_type:complete